jgi:hypothetical protein
MGDVKQQDIAAVQLPDLGASQNRAGHWQPPTPAAPNASAKSMKSIPWATSKATALAGVAEAQNKLAHAGMNRKVYLPVCGA